MRSVKPAVRKPPEPAPVRIERIGADGDGVSTLPDGAPVYIPFTLPGEAVTANPLRPRGEGWLARADSIDAPSPDRATPPCAYFGRCGGCALQHWNLAGYAAWKTGLLEAALRRAGFAAIPPIAFVPGQPARRRRLDFAVRRDRGRLVLGLHEAGSPDVVDLTHCHVLHPALTALIAPLRPVLQGLAAIKREASVVVNLLDNGPDMLLRTDAPLTLADRNALIGFARAEGVPRVTWGAGAAGEPVCTFQPPSCLFSGTQVRPPPGAFLQATTDGEAAIIAAVLAGLPAKLAPKARIAEMFAGCGTLTFALAARARVAAWEGDGPVVAALRDAVNRAGLPGRIEASQRDLARQPLTAKELSGFAAVVLDPPHAGAAAQVGQIAASGVGCVVYVGCNPATLSRDARLLSAAGYSLSAATAIDQFLWSARLESVCVFKR
jgi:23S rRNA (uracil1939-C5)-methyltransferase